MRTGLSFVAACAAVNVASAHYIFWDFAVGSQAYGKYAVTRENANYNSPVTDLDSNDLRCNVGGTTGKTTGIAEMTAGQTFSFTSDVAVYHQGPVSLFLSKVPDGMEVGDYTGDGKWAKFKDFGPSFTQTSWGASQADWSLKQKYTWSLPTCIPDGQYLLRIQSLGIHNPYPSGIPQFYISCAQLNVTGGSNTGAWNPTLDIPGAFKVSDSGYTVNIYDPNFSSYEAPGGPEMTC